MPFSGTIPTACSSTIVEALSQDSGHVAATFTNWKTVASDVLIGCDGAASKVRACAFGDEAVNYTGQVAFRALLPIADVPAGIMKMPFAMFVGVGRVMLHYPLRHRTIMNVVSVAREPRWQEEGWTIPATIEEFARLHSDFHPDALELIRAIPPGTLFKWGLRDREPLQQYSKGRVTMLGDAAHPMTPFLGQGACIAIEDAMVLGRAFAAASTWRRRSPFTKIHGKNAPTVFSSLLVSRLMRIKASLRGERTPE